MIQLKMFKKVRRGKDLPPSGYPLYKMFTYVFRRNTTNETMTEILQNESVWIKLKYNAGELGFNITMNGRNVTINDIPYNMFAYKC